MNRLFFIAILAFTVSLNPVSRASAAETSASSDEPVLVVGTKVAPPFVMKQDNGDYTGISIELWKQAAKELGLKYRFQETDLKGLIDGLQDGSLDASVAALTVTAAREEVIDFTHPFHTTGLAIAASQQGSTVWSSVKRLFSWQFLVALAALVGLLLLVGVVLWLAERGKNKEMFGGSPAQGIGASFWWAAVTMTTVGYGDKAPVTLAGRIVGLIWMFAAIILISSFTAAIATSLTVSQLETSVKGVDDLPDVRVATVTHSASADYLTQRGIGFTARDNLESALKALASDRVDALVYDKPILQYLVREQYPDQIRVLPNTFERQDYAIALPDGSKLREPLNQTLLTIIASDQWQSVLTRYLGASGR
ncbi:MAG: transporter substrate-binding domain-containing protein [Marinobacter sp.]|nr:transporter substrate-binding domain-containing protein [Marinobacter sp.]